MAVGEDYGLALGSLTLRVRLLETSDDLQAAERARVRFRDGARKGEVREVSIDDLVVHWETGRRLARPMPTPRPNPPGVRRRAA